MEEVVKEELVLQRYLVRKQREIMSIFVYRRICESASGLSAYSATSFFVMENLHYHKESLHTGRITCISHSSFPRHGVVCTGTLIEHNSTLRITVWSHLYLLRGFCLDCHSPACPHVLPDM